MNNSLIEELYKTIEAKDNIINNQVLEISHLNLQLDQALKDYEELLIKIDKAIEYIKEMQNSCLVFSNIAYKELLEILGEKENE